MCSAALSVKGSFDSPRVLVRVLEDRVDVKLTL
jgi:hypothetical protein